MRSDNEKSKETNADSTQLIPIESAEEIEVSKRIDEIKYEDKVSQKTLIIVMIISCFAGMIIGIGMFSLGIYFDKSGIDFVEFWNRLQLDATRYIRWIFVAFVVIVFVLSYIELIRARKRWKDRSNRDDNWDWIEKRISNSIFLAGMLMIGNLVLFILSTYMLSITMPPIIIFASIITLFLATIFAALQLQRKNINLVKEMNPEKKGSAYDLKFDNKWYASCDEAERKMIGIAAYNTYRKMMYVYITVIVLLYFLCFRFALGMLPIVITGLFWLISTIIYYREVSKSIKVLKE